MSPNQGISSPRGLPKTVLLVHKVFLFLSPLFSSPFLCTPFPSLGVLSESPFPLVSFNYSQFPSECHQGLGRESFGNSKSMGGRLYIGHLTFCVLSADSPPHMEEVVPVSESGRHPVALIALESPSITTLFSLVLPLSLNFSAFNCSLFFFLPSWSAPTNSASSLELQFWLLILCYLWGLCIQYMVLLNFPFSNIKLLIHLVPF